MRQLGGAVMSSIGAGVKPILFLKRQRLVKLYA